MERFNGTGFGLAILGGADADGDDRSTEFRDQYARAREVEPGPEAPETIAKPGS
jgi:hypothetical protein